jgi:hypothetical protein
MSARALQIFVGASYQRNARIFSAVVFILYAALDVRRILRQKLIGYSPSNDWI